LPVFDEMARACVANDNGEDHMKVKGVAKTLEIQTVRQQQIGEGVGLGVLLGRRQAFALVAGRCSAADAECIREVRRDKRYRVLKMTWDQFCEERLGVTSVTANKIVRQLEEFGPEFFTLAQLTRVTPEEYRRLKVAVRGHKLLHAGEEIPIEAENGPRLAAAIDELRRNAKVEPTAVVEPAESPSATPADSMTDAERGISSAAQSLDAALTELERLRASQLDLGDRVRLHSLVGYGAHRFNLLQLAVRV
jgi:hypothetical protein